MAKLYVVATPIGNLQDWTPRAIETLRNADLIAAEDTRVTGILCHAYDIRTPITSCHQHNEDTKGIHLAEKIAAECAPGTAARRVLVMATPVALKEERVRTLIQRVDGDHRVDLLPMPELVRFAEDEQFDSPALTDYLTEQFSTVHPEDYVALVLGCTHFNYFKDRYRMFFSQDTALIDGNFGTVRHLAHRLGIPRQDVPNGTVIFEDKATLLARTTYFTSGRPVTDDEMLEHFRRLHNRLENMRKIC